MRSNRQHPSAAKANGSNSIQRLDDSPQAATVSTDDALWLAISAFGLGIGVGFLIWWFLSVIFHVQW